MLERAYCSNFKKYYKGFMIFGEAIQMYHLCSHIFVIALQVDVNMFLIPELLFDSSAAVVLSSSNSTQVHSL